MHLEIGLLLAFHNLKFDFLFYIYMHIKVVYNVVAPFYYFPLSLSLPYSYTIASERIGGPQKGTIFVRLIISSSIDNFQTFFTVRIRSKFVMTLSLKILPHVKCVTTLPCEISVS